MYNTTFLLVVDIHINLVLDIDNPERLIYKSLTGYMSKLLSMQDNLLKASAAELLRTDALRLTTREQRQSEKENKN